MVKPVEILFWVTDWAEPKGPDLPCEGAILKKITHRGVLMTLFSELCKSG